MTNIQEINNIVVQAVNKLSESASQMIRMVNDNVMNDYDKFVQIARQYKDDADYTYTVLRSFSDKAMSIKETMIAMNNGINDISTAMNDSAQGVTSVAEDISELANAISLILFSLNSCMTFSFSSFFIAFDTLFAFDIETRDLLYWYS